MAMALDHGLARFPALALIDTTRTRNLSRKAVLVKQGKNTDTGDTR
jgi:hypothetical protein